MTAATDCEQRTKLNHGAYWDIHQLAAFYGVCVRTVQRWIRCGQLSQPIKMGRKRLWVPSQVMEWMERRGAEAQTTLAAQNFTHFVSPIKRRRSDGNNK